MKKIKLSLAASLVAGTFSFANAVALDEAIQNVDFTGELRYRYDTDLLKTKEVNDKGEETVTNENSQKHKYRANLKFTADIADNFKATALIRYGEVTDNSYGDTRLDTNASTRGTFRLREAYLTYKNEDFGTSLSFGKMKVNSIWTDDLVGNGITLTNNSVEGVTFAAFMFDNFELNSYLVPMLETTKLDKDGKPVMGKDNKAETITADPVAHNLYGVAVLLDYDMVSAGLWFSYLKSVGSLYAVDLAFNGGDEDFGYGIHAQYAGNSLKGDLKETFNVANNNFMGIEASLNAAGFDLSLGYVTFGKKDKTTIVALHDKGQFINVGELAMDGYHGTNSKHNYFFATLGYTYDKVRFGIDFVKGDRKTKVNENTDSKTKLTEITPRLSYKYSDKLEFSGFYAYSTAKEGDNKTTEKQIRFEAKYTF